MQFLKVQRTLLKLTLPNRFLVASPHNAPEVRSNEAFRENPDVERQLHIGADEHGVRHGLKQGLELLKAIRPGVREVVGCYLGRAKKN